MCDLETSRMRRLVPRSAAAPQGGKNEVTRKFDLKATSSSQNSENIKEEILKQSV